MTGGAGFIGTHVVRLLLDSGYEVLVVDDLRHASGEAPPPGVRLLELDLTSAAAKAEMARFGPEKVVHLAAQGGVSRSLKDPAADAVANVVASVSLMRTALDLNVSHFVFASSGGAIYGEASVRPTPETHAPAPLSPYGAAKLAAEGYLGMFSRTHGLFSSSLRFGNVYGPYQDGTGEAGVVAISSSRLLDGGSPVIRGDGEQTRDFVYVGDVARSVVAALRHPLAGPVNIASGRETSVNEVVNALIRHSGRKLQAAREPARGGEVRSVCLEVSLARRSLGWQATTTLEEGLKTTFESFASRRPDAAAVPGTGS